MCISRTEDDEDNLEQALSALEPPADMSDGRAGQLNRPGGALEGSKNGPSRKSIVGSEVPSLQIPSCLV
jgi:hypothetical protein